MAYRDATELWQDRLESYLKEGLDKEGEDTNPQTSTDPKDETRSTVGTTNLYDEPVDRHQENMHAAWGEDTNSKDKNEAEHFSSGVENAYVDTQHGVLDGAFSSKSTAEKADQQLISANFAHGASGNFESRAPTLQNKSRETKAKKEPTLMEKVRATTGRH